MRRLTGVLVAVSLAVAGLSVAVSADSEEAAAGTIAGTSDAVALRLRNLETGLASHKVQVAFGSFQFAGVTPSSYVIEMLDEQGTVVGTSAVIAVVPSQTTTVHLLRPAASASSPAAVQDDDDDETGTAGWIWGGTAAGLTAGGVIFANQNSGKQGESNVTGQAGNTGPSTLDPTGAAAKSGTLSPAR